MGTSQGAPGVVSNGQRGGGDLTSGSGVSKVNCSEVGAGEGELSLASGGTSVGINFISRNQFKITKSTAKKIFDPLGKGFSSFWVENRVEKFNCGAICSK
jgi:hypothetical protein